MAGGDEQAGRKPMAFEQRLSGMEIIGITIVEGDYGSPTRVASLLLDYK